MLRSNKSIVISAEICIIAHKIENNMVDNKSIAIWKSHLQEEIDASYLYMVLAGMENNEKQKDIYSRLSEVEKKHIKVWRDLLLKHNISIKKD